MGICNSEKRMSKISPRHSTTMPIVPLKTASKAPVLGAYDRRFHVMAKPGGAKCNIDCQYCFYLHKENLLHQEKQPKMDDATLEAFVKAISKVRMAKKLYSHGRAGSRRCLGWTISAMS